MKGVVWDAVGSDIRPDIFARPFQQRIELEQPIGIIPRLNLQILPLRRLLSPEPGHPALLPRKRSLERQYLANLAALQPLGNTTVKAIRSILLDPGFDRL
jgi:hypothetical protein